MATCKSPNKNTVTKEKQLEIAFGAVLLCAKQGIIMKGQIKKPLYQYSDDEDDSDDNVLAFTNFALRGATGDCGSGSQPKKRTPNPVILTKETQDQILETARHMITCRLVSEINEAKFFSLISEKMLKDDDACRIPLYARFVDKNLKIREELLQFVPRGTRSPGETWGATICKSILRVMTEIGVNMQFCRGLNLDSTGMDLQEATDVIRHIQAEYPKAIYVHSRSDLLNVCIPWSSDMSKVTFMMYIMQFSVKLFNMEDKDSLELFQRMIRDVMPEDEHSHLIQLSQTDWASTSLQFQNWVKLFPAIIATYDEVHAGPFLGYSEKFHLAHGNSLMMLEFEFIITMVIVANCLELTNDLTDELQRECYDSTSIREKVSELLAKLDELKSNIEECHIAYYEQAVDLATKIEIEPKKDKFFNSKTKPDPNPNESICEYYLKKITLPFLDHLEAQIRIRFSEGCLDALDGLAVLPSNVGGNAKVWKEPASRFLKRYKCDLPESDTSLDIALESWERRWKDEHRAPDTALSLLSSYNMEHSMQIFTAFKIFASMPVIPTESEIPRLMPFIHQDLCLYSMTDKYLNALALMSTRGHQLETEDVIESFKMKYTLPVVEDSVCNFKNFQKFR